MSYSLWVDDQARDPETPKRHAPEGFVVATSSQEAMDIVDDLGPPDFMDLDHDLGGDDKVITFLNYLFELYPDNPPDYRVHSENVEGQKNIISFMESWHKSLKL